MSSRSNTNHTWMDGHELRNMEEGTNGSTEDVRSLPLSKRLRSEEKVYVGALSATTAVLAVSQVLRAFNGGKPETQSSDCTSRLSRSLPLAPQSHTTFGTSTTDTTTDTSPTPTTEVIFVTPTPSTNSGNTH
nr:uncharacterized protein CI109_003725 [Kwoniella shandongensis]KAA5528070.1 hypothetical protein CI109_003725 [Kwoniella shandongensis]